MPTTSTPATAMRYRDVAAAADWLCSAFGFEKQTVLTDDAGAPLYAQLTCGRTMLMLAPVRATAVDKLMKQPDEIGGAETQSGYYVVGDADAHYARATAAGATVVLNVEDDDFGGRSYTCRDPEGHIWTFGTYDPWQGKFPAPAAVSPPATSGARRFMRAVFTLAVVGGVGVAGWYGGALTQSSAVSSMARVQPEDASRKRQKSAALEAAERAARNALIELERVRAARALADAASEQALKNVAEAQQARQAAERAVAEMRAQLEQEREAKVTAAAAHSADVASRVKDVQRARQAAERAAKEARAALEKARADKVAAEMAKDFALGRAEEEQLGREAAERAVKEARADVERQRAAAKQAADTAKSAGSSKGMADLQRALDEAKKLVAAEQSARAAAEQSVKEAHAQLAKEKAAKAQAWKVVSQLTKQLKQAKSRPRPKKKTDETD